ncbi:MAG TPA: hypothetical protein PLQ18_11625, partial [Plasticicumulans sp.]|nr:hypothetical protein [Plasticicumulans sp.]
MRRRALSRLHPLQGWGGVTGEDEAFSLRVCNARDYRYHGADMGILVSRGRMQTDDRELFPRAK